MPCFSDAVPACNRLHQACDSLSWFSDFGAGRSRGRQELAIPGAAVGRLCDSSECGKFECTVPDCALLYAREACDALHRAFVS